jgi:NADPH2:quinone reductase
MIYSRQTRTLRRGQLLIRTLATSTNSALGTDVAAVVEDVGPDTTRFARGDRVFGKLAMPLRGLFGAQADEIVVSEEAPLAPIPPGLDPVVAATLPTAAATALDIVDTLEPLSGKTVLIVGAGDAMGSFATQFAANAGGYVIAQTPAFDAARIRAYGAAETVDGSSLELMTAVASAHPRGIDTLIDLVSDAPAFADLVLLLRGWGPALTTLGVADPYGLATAEVIGINHTPKISAELLRRVGEAIVERRVFVPPTAGLQLADAA